MSRDTLHHICLSYIKNNNNNDFHTKMLWLSERAKFGIKRVRLRAALPIYLKVSVVQEGSLAFSAGTAASQKDLDAAAHYATGIFFVKFFGSSDGKVRLVTNASSNLKAVSSRQQVVLYTQNRPPKSGGKAVRSHSTHLCSDTSTLG